MKKFLLSVAAAVAVMVSFTGCGKDDGGSGSISGTIVGKWKCVSELYYYGKNGNWTLDEEEQDVYDDDYGLIADFKSDGRFIETMWEDDEEWEQEGTYTFDAETKTLSFTYDEDDDYSDDYTVNTLTSNKLVISIIYEEEDSETGDDIKVVMTFKRINSNN